MTCDCNIELMEGFTASLIIEVYPDWRQWIDSHAIINKGELLTWVGVDSWRIIRMAVTEEKVPNDTALANMVCHECVHFMMREYTGANLPVGLDEGFAVYLAQKLPRACLQALEQGLVRDGLLPLQFLDLSFTPFDRTSKSLASAQVSTLVQYIAKTYGFVQKLLCGCKNSESINWILKQRGLRVYLLEVEVSRWLEENFLPRLAREELQSV
ncbi:gluzincin family metallopeptidase [Desulfotalea psychrophila]|uniref:Peptidase MA-like domain-containing protein n=1 Tax=Desulfotalea psychrophila (strain LSv54 / DSM 12343) TaxID=177439 RepID=Q6AKH2_DESPS|nr:hypothetical protein [Desulfotalea psychrophila]CAG37153.1 unknown protein [Desulfotalea psychrophila LSv54]